MDLREQIKSETKRHPWETARVNTVKLLLQGKINKETKVLDIGCGDGYCGRELFRELGPKELTALDVNLTAEKIADLSGLEPGITYLNTCSKLSGKKFELILLMDVLEHIDDERVFLSGLINTHLSESGTIFISVPLFESLFTSHDRFLGHHRRYTLSGLRQVAESCGLEILEFGCLFTSLLLPRFLSVILERVAKIVPRHHGVGNWKAGPGPTGMIEQFLTLENRLSIMLNRVGIRVPGLTGWALCRRQP